MTNEEYVESRGGIDQAYCAECGRNLVIYCDDSRTASEIICWRCEKGLTPEWEYQMPLTENPRLYPSALVQALGYS